MTYLSNGDESATSVMTTIKVMETAHNLRSVFSKWARIHQLGQMVEDTGQRML